MLLWRKSPFRFSCWSFQNDSRLASIFITSQRDCAEKSNSKLSHSRTLM
jgi:hypothetical protein